MQKQLAVMLVWVWTNSYCIRDRILLKCCVKSLREVFARQMFSLLLSSRNRLFRMKKSKLAGSKMLKWENRRKIWLTRLISSGLGIPFLLNWSSLAIFFPEFILHPAHIWSLPCVPSQAHWQFSLAPLTGDSKLHGEDDPPLLYIYKSELLCGKLQHIAHLLCMYCFFIPTYNLSNFWGISGARCTSFQWDCLFQVPLDASYKPVTDLWCSVSLLWSWIWL